jgi:hypothetical protein
MHKFIHLNLDQPLGHQGRVGRVGLEPPTIVNLLTVKIRQPSHEFTFGVGMNFILYLLVLTPVV